jgi:ubiquitin C-terminal hydrolase
LLYFKEIINLLRYYLGNEASAYHSNIEEEQEAVLKQFEVFLATFPSILMAEQGTNTSWVDMYRKGLIVNNNKAIKYKFSQALQMCVLSKDLSTDQFIHLLTPLYKTTLLVAYISIERATPYFLTVSSLIEQCPDEEKKKRLIGLINFEDIWKKVLPTLLKSSDQQLLESIFKFLRGSLYGKESIKAWAEENRLQIVDLIILYLIDPTGKQKSKPVIQTPETKAAFLHFLKEIFLVEASLRDPVCGFFNGLLSNIKWRKRKTDAWEFELGGEEDKEIRYSGLVNQGCTCYVNSVFQQLFMLEDFRNFLIDAPSEEGSIMLQARRLLRALRDSGKASLSTKNFTNVFTNFDGSALNPLEQMDADEFFNNLMDKIETSLKKNNQESAIKRTFGGKIVQEVVGSDCKHRSSRETEFLTLSLDVKGKTSVKQSFEKLVEGELLDGENMYSCDSCNKKVKAFKRESLKHLPNTLLLVLKRFEFNFETMTKHKLNSYCEFPENLDLRPYSSDSLSEGLEEKDRPPEYFKYSLAGVIIHTGTTDSGHYYSLIRSKEGKWIEFNDTSINDFNIEHLASLAFGHKLDQSQTAAGLNSPGSTNLSRGTSAYMLLYQREALFDENDAPIQKLMQNINEVQSTETENAEEKALQLEYFESQIKRLVLDNAFADWLKDGITRMPEWDLNLKESESFIQLVYFVFFLAQVRAKYKTVAFNMAEVLVQKLKDSPKLCNWLLTNSSNMDFLNEFCMDCPRLIAKELVFATVIQALKTTLQAEPGMTITNSSLVASAVNVPDSPKSPSKSKEVPFHLIPAKNFMLLCFEAVVKNREGDLQRLNLQLFKVLEVCTSFPLFSAILYKKKFVEKMLHITGAVDYESLMGDKFEKNVSLPTVFKGYDGSNGSESGSKYESLQDRRVEALQNRLFKLDMSSLVIAIINVMKLQPTEVSENVKMLFEKDHWPKLLKLCNHNRSRKIVSELISDYCGTNVEQIEKVVSLFTDYLQEKELTQHQLKSFLYLIRHLFNNLKLKVTS